MTATKRTAVMMAAAMTAAIAVPISASAAPETAASTSKARVVLAHGGLRDLQPAAAGAFDRARAALLMVQYDGRSLVWLQVNGIDRSMAGRSFGAHLHVGPCVAGDGAAAGPHYNSDTVAGRVPPRIGPDTEIWLDFTVTRAGTGFAITKVPFIALPGNRAIVIHQEPTDPNGVAGLRLACLPVSW
ncbi:hypothetical protein [Kribbella qitaiheensis]|nr:hypothetical protein [Kribbella qitaiheensis]